MNRPAPSGGAPRAAMPDIRPGRPGMGPNARLHVEKPKNMWRTIGRLLRYIGRNGVLLAALLVFMVLKGKRAVFATYLGAYGVFRFLLEFLRGDPRGESPLALFSPSQLTALLMIFAAAALYLAETYLLEKNRQNAAPTDEEKEEKGDIL